MMMNKIFADLNRWWNVQVTIHELNKLDNAELNDLGISRWKIQAIAQQLSH